MIPHLFVPLQPFLSYSIELGIDAPLACTILFHFPFTIPLSLSTDLIYTSSSWSQRAAFFVARGCFLVDDEGQKGASE